VLRKRVPDGWFSLPKSSFGAIKLFLRAMMRSLLHSCFSPTESTTFVATPSHHFNPCASCNVTSGGSPPPERTFGHVFSNYFSKGVSTRSDAISMSRIGYCSPSKIRRGYFAEMFFPHGDCVQVERTAHGRLCRRSFHWTVSIVNTRWYARRKSVPDRPCFVGHYPIVMVTRPCVYRMVSSRGSDACWFGHAT
jgi:hypothetical protein